MSNNVAVVILDDSDRTKCILSVRLEIGDESLEGEVDYNVETMHYEFHRQTITNTIDTLNVQDQRWIKSQIREKVTILLSEKYKKK
jgi:hypothetical protein